MSCNYADGLSPYENKGVLGLPEKFDSIDKLNRKCEILAQLIAQSNHTVVHTGAGISTSAGIPDFRGPNGVWTLEKKGQKPTINVSFAEAKPTKTHMMLKKLVDSNKIQYIISQNIDGLHMKSGLQRKYLSELHGNMFVDECNLCRRQFVRHSPVETVGKKCSGVPCAAELVLGRPCRGRLYDGVLDWEHDLPENDLLMAEWHSGIADLSICLGTTLQIVPSGNLPLETVKYGGKLVICNLQPTKHDNKADLILNYYVDDILERVMNILNLDTPDYNPNNNPTLLAENSIIDWTIPKKEVMRLDKIYKKKTKGVKKIRVTIKNKKNEDGMNNFDHNKTESSSKKIKLDIKCEKDNGNEVFNGHVVDNMSIKVENNEQINLDTQTNFMNVTNKNNIEKDRNSVEISTEVSLKELDSVSRYTNDKEQSQKDINSEVDTCK